MKKKAFAIAGLSLFLIIFNLLFFIGSESVSDIKSSVWISYGFIHFAYLLFVFSPLTIRKSSVASDYSVATISSLLLYFILEFIVGMIFIWSAPDSIFWALSLQAIGAGIHLAYYFMHLYANEHTADAIAKHECELVFVKQNAAQLQFIMESLKGGDKADFKSVEQCYDALRMSPAKSSLSVAPIEEEIKEKISLLEHAAMDKDSTAISSLAAMIVTLTKKRNIQLQMDRRN